ncbi:DUF3592 domain-containing protein [Corallincola platygyrae]|uniref:DUF3592 domain-containing protein n=1 Tax=Corallincola platygyrae TaxID=1193278 RepID=A0ABW4XIQ0_9GAMM
MNTPPLVVELCISIFCLYMANHAFKNYKKAKDSESWNAVTGILENVELWGTRRVDGEMLPVEKIRVKYSYTVGRGKYMGSTVAFYTIHYPETVNFYQAHEQGKPISVRFNPERPDESVLIPGRHPIKPYSELILAGIAVAIGVCVPLGSWFGLIG